MVTKKVVSRMITTVGMFSLSTNQKKWIDLAKNRLKIVKNSLVFCYTFCGVKDKFLPQY
jgi:hypothetical protein